MAKLTLNIEHHRFRVLDSWRGVCACLVALFHFRARVYSHIYGVGLIDNAYLFVDFFFVLSGFVIFANYEDRLRRGFGFWRFMLLRFGRLYPLHFFILMGLIGVEAAQLLIPQLQAFSSERPFQGQDNRLAFIPAQLLLAHGLGFSTISFNYQSWSISAEFYAYAVFAGLIVSLKKRANFALAAVMALAGGFLVCKQTYLATDYQYGFIRCLYSFALGGVLWKGFSLYQGRCFAWAAQRRNLMHGIEVVAVVAAIAGVASASGPARMALPFLFAAVIWIFALETGCVSRLLSHRVFLLLGMLSYSIYMLHGPINNKFSIILNVLKKVFPGPEHGTYYCIERPGRTVFRRIAGAKEKIS